MGFVRSALLFLDIRLPNDNPGIDKLGRQPLGHSANNLP
jgi:hypothetical protein